MQAPDWIKLKIWYAAKMFRYWATWKIIFISAMLDFKMTATFIDHNEVNGLKYWQPYWFQNDHYEKITFTNISRSDTATYQVNQPLVRLYLCVCYVVAMIVIVVV